METIVIYHGQVKGFEKSIEKNCDKKKPFCQKWKFSFGLQD